MSRKLIDRRPDDATSRVEHDDEDEEEAEEEVGQAPSFDQASWTARIKSRGERRYVCLASFAVVSDDELVVQVVTEFLRVTIRTPSVCRTPGTCLMPSARFFVSPYTLDMIAAGTMTPDMGQNVTFSRVGPVIFLKRDER